MNIRLLVLGAAFSALPALAQVEVMEPGDPGMAPARGTRTVQTVGSEASRGELYNQVLLLQDEVMKLNGMVEELSEQLRQLKQQRLDDYIGLDKRITALGGAAPAAAGGAPQAPAPGPALAAPVQGQDMPSAAAPPGGAIRADVAPMSPASVPERPVAGEQQAYQAAFELIRTRQFPQAKTAFAAFLEQYPAGALTGNAHFWLGELLLLDGDSEGAKPHYEALVYQFPGSTKMPDGLFKLGRIYHQEGDAARGRELLQRVIDEYGNSDSSAPRLAREYLQQNF